MALNNTKIQQKKQIIGKKKSFNEFFSRRNKKIGIGAALLVILIGVYFLFFASAATNNCQPENGVQICDVDQSISVSDNVLSTKGEAESLGASGWGTYYGAAFRAPETAYNGAVPVHRLLNGSASWHEFVTDAQKGQKEAAAGGADKLTYEGVAFFAWTNPGQPGTVPIYRITASGTSTLSAFSSDKGWIDQMLSGPWGWKADEVMPLIAFYAYPPTYKVAGLANPYDCSILENFTSPRCTKAAENLQTGIAAGTVTSTAECPKNWDAWKKAAFPGKLEQACQDKWNAYSVDCKNSDVFQSDRCKKEREALAAENQRQIAARNAAADTAKKTTKTTTKTTNNSGGGSGNVSQGGSGGTKPSAVPLLACPGSTEAWKKLSTSQKNQTGKDCTSWWVTVITNETIARTRTGVVKSCPKNPGEWQAIPVLTRGLYGKDCNDFWATYIKNRMPKGVVPTVPKSSFDTASTSNTGAKRSVKASECKSSVTTFLRDLENGNALTATISNIPGVTNLENLDPIKSNFKTLKNYVYKALDAGSCADAENIVKKAYSTLSSNISTLNSMIQLTRSIVGQGLGVAITPGLKVISNGQNIKNGVKVGICVVSARLWCPN